MSYLKSTYNNTNTLNVDSEIIYELIVSLKTTTKDIIQQAFTLYIKDTSIQKSSDEETITACIYSKLKALVDLEQYCTIEVVAEPRQYTQIHTTGIRNPKTAKRFDLYFIHFHSEQKRKFRFIVEAKMLCLFDIGTRYAIDLQNKYVTQNGMGRFINGDFIHEGFMLGYLINGNENEIIKKLNLIIAKAYSSTHTISTSKRGNYSKYKLQNTSKELGHIFVNLN
jgi:hypothetical protein